MLRICLGGGIDETGCSVLRRDRLIETFQFVLCELNGISFDIILNGSVVDVETFMKIMKTHDGLISVLVKVAMNNL